MCHAISRCLTKSRQDKKAIVNHGLFCFMMEEEKHRLTHIKWIFWGSVIQQLRRDGMYLTLDISPIFRIIEGSLFNLLRDKTAHFHIEVVTDFIFRHQLG
ncbi:hypothetical protein Dd703_0130 [Musicola paradisiaca Ech703]|uniref:Uncharacterized protein n=1 Tax=Musicola paradisiaca (strain Ech703) TaxID=579405 RepID=C6C6N0_MUSP7|nr:hypothetical protein Dd703_0130 [Musicola paradisiaca Ech703]